MLNAWKTCISASLFFFFAFILMTIFNSISLQIINELHLTGHQLGFISASYLLANVIFLIPAGIFIDHYSVKKALLTSTIIAGILTLAFSQIRNMEQGIVINFLIGICATFSFISPIKLIKQWFPEEKIALVTGLIIAFAMFGGILANTLFVPIVSSIGWRQVFIILGIIALIFAFAEWLFVTEVDSSKQRLNSFEGSTSANKKNRQIKILLAGTYNSLLNLSIPILGAEWGILYLMKIFNLSKYNAGIVISMLFIGMSIGSFLMGWLSEKHIRKSVLTKKAVPETDKFF